MGLLLFVRSCDSLFIFQYNIKNPRTCEGFSPKQSRDRSARGKILSPNRHCDADRRKQSIDSANAASSLQMDHRVASAMLLAKTDGGRHECVRVLGSPHPLARVRDFDSLFFSIKYEKNPELARALARSNLGTGRHKCQYLHGITTSRLRRSS